MMPACNKGPGMCQAMPDVCKTPAPPAPVPPPIPYPNIGMLSMASKTSKKVKIVNAETITTKSEIPSSNGDNPGVAGGVKSGVNMQKITFTKGSSKVSAEGAPVVHLNAPTQHNGPSANVPGTVKLVGQMKVLVKP